VLGPMLVHVPGFLPAGNGWPFTAVNPARARFMSVTAMVESG
jgi:hypothetical protein